MSAIILNTPGKNLDPKFRDSARLIEGFKLIYIDEHGEVCTPVEVRVYVNNAYTRNYAAVWLHSEVFDWRKGFGMAGGGGYHRASAAIQDAFDRTGVTYEGIEYFSGRGMSAAADAFKKLCEQAGLPPVHVITFNP